jgi:hypothetical protein
MSPLEEKLLREGTLEEFMDGVQVMDKDFLLLATQLGKEHHVRYILDKRRWPIVFPLETIENAVKVAQECGHSQIVDFLKTNIELTALRFEVTCSARTFYVILVSCVVYYNRLSLGRMFSTVCF